MKAACNPQAEAGNPIFNQEVRMDTPQFQTQAPSLADVPMQPASLDIWDKKYRLKDKAGNPVDQTIDETYMRVADALADVEKEDVRDHWRTRFLWALRHGAIPAGRITSNAGAQEHKPATSLINCTVSDTIPDSMDGILTRVHEAGMTLKSGCGIGYEISSLRTRGVNLPRATPP